MDRADKILKRRFPSLTKRQVNEALEAGLAKFQGKKTRPGDKVGGLETADLEAYIEELRKGNTSLSVPVVAEGEGFSVIDKPAGMPSHPLSLFDKNTVTHWALAKYPGLTKEFPEIQPTVCPHRLDTGTSGLLIVAHTAKAFEQWRERFANKEVHKTYLAWCWGRLAPREFSIDYPIAHNLSDDSRMVCVKGRERHRPPLMPASTSVKVLKVSSKGCFLAEIECATGVTHQVRVHLASLGFPLVGDQLYDLEYESRTVNPEFHWLRAVSLRHADVTYELDKTPFERLMD